MGEISSAPDVGALEVPIDVWTAPFWEAAASETLLLPRCGTCARFRWPPGPFCPHCQSQQTEWRPAGPGRIYSYTIVRSSGENGAGKLRAPALVEFPDAGRVRMLAAIVDAQPDRLAIGATLRVDWVNTANVKAPIFRLV